MQPILGNMAELTFQDLTFEDLDDKIRVTLMRLWYFDILRAELGGNIQAKGHSVLFSDLDELSARALFNRVLDQGLNNLTNKVTGNPTVYIHRGSGIPLIGSLAFGLVDRDTNLIEAKAMSGCHLNCVYCSVDEGPNSRKIVDYLVEKEYLVEELNKLVAFKDEDVGIVLNIHGEPMLYPKLAELAQDISANHHVRMISVYTNGMLLTRPIIDQLSKVPQMEITVSLNAVDEQIASRMAGAPYPVRHVMEMLRYAASRMKVAIAPLYMEGINEAEFPKLIAFARECNMPIAPQNFLNYRFGRNPQTQIPMDEFYRKLRVWEQEYGVRLVHEDLFMPVRMTRKLPKPFRKGQIVQAIIAMPGRYPNEKLVAASDRTITVPRCSHKPGQMARIRVLRAKDNVFYAECLA